MTVVPFKRPETRETGPVVKPRRSLAEFAVAMALAGLVFFMLPMLWSGVSTQLLAVIHLLIAVVYFQQGPKVAAGIWITLTVATLVITSAPSPVTYLLWRGAQSFDSALVDATVK